MSKNFSYSLVATAPSPATSGTSLVVTGGDGTKFPAVPFPATIWPINARPTTANAEVVTVTAISTDTFTIVRAQENSTARTVIIGDQIAATDTANIEAVAHLFKSQNGLPDSVVLTASSDFSYDNLLGINSTGVLEIPATSTLEINAYYDPGTTDIRNTTLHDTYMGDVFDSQSDIVRNITLDGGKDFIAPETLAIATNYSLEIPFNSTLEIRAWVDNATPINARNISNPHKFRVSQNAAANSGNGAFAVVPFDTEQFDTSNNINAGVFTAPVAGFYHFDWGISITTSGAEIVISALYINGAEYTRGVQNALTTSTIKSVGSDLVQMAAGNTADVRAFCSATRGLNVGNTNANTFAGFLVSST